MLWQPFLPQEHLRLSLWMKISHQAATFSSHSCCYDDDVMLFVLSVNSINNCGCSLGELGSSVSSEPYKVTGSFFLFLLIYDKQTLLCLTVPCLPSSITTTLASVTKR